jgi:ribosome maturation factor RimP
MVDDLTARVTDALTGPVAAQGVDLEDVEVVRAGRRRLVRVSIDTDQGITLDDVAAVTRVVSQTLDETDVMGDQSYTLEVGSPGVSRPLTLPRHWRRNIGRLVRIVPADGSAPYEARIAAVDDAAHITLTGSSGEITVQQDDIRRAVVQVELSRPVEKSPDGH